MTIKRKHHRNFRFVSNENGEKKRSVYTFIYFKKYIFTRSYANSLRPIINI